MTREQIERKLGYDGTELVLEGLGVTDADMALVPASVTDLRFDNCPGIGDGLQVPASVTYLLFYDCPGKIGRAHV